MDLARAETALSRLRATLADGGDAYGALQALRTVASRRLEAREPTARAEGWHLIVNGKCTRCAARRGLPLVRIFQRRRLFFPAGARALAAAGRAPEAYDCADLFLSHRTQAAGSQPFNAAASAALQACVAAVSPPAPLAALAARAAFAKRVRCWQACVRPDEFAACLCASHPPLCRLARRPCDGRPPRPPRLLPQRPPKPTARRRRRSLRGPPRAACSRARTSPRHARRATRLCVRWRHRRAAARRARRCRR